MRSISGEACDAYEAAKNGLVPKRGLGVRLPYFRATNRLGIMYTPRHFDVFNSA